MIRIFFLFLMTNLISLKDDFKCGIVLEQMVSGMPDILNIIEAGKCLFMPNAFHWRSKFGLF